MDKLRMQTANKADENFKKLAAMFPNAVTETRSAISSLGRTRKSPFCLPMRPSTKRCALFVKMKRFLPGQIVRENLIAALVAWTLIPQRTSISRVTTLKC